MKLMHTLIAAAATSVVSTAASLVLALAVLGAGHPSYFAVQSDSMAPLIQRGDLVITANRKTLNVGDAVTFHKYGKLVTHRLAAVGRQPGTFETRGDANPSVDPWTINASDVVGTVQGVVTNAGWPLLWVSSALGRLLTCGVLLLAVIAMLWAIPRVIYTQALP